jgi:SAM-dependent methyltransferase
MTPDSPTPAPDFDPPPLDPRLTALLTDYPSTLFGERLHHSIELMERYSIDLSIDVLDRLGIIQHIADWRSAPELCVELDFAPRFSVALAWLLERLIETDCLDVRRIDRARQYRLRKPPWAPALAELRAAGIAIDPANRATLDLLDHAASIYPAVSRGETSGEQALFGMQGIPLWLNYFHNENRAYAVNNWLGAIAAADRVAAHASLRIMEIGAGAGSASETLLRTLSERGLAPRIECYLITEPNAFFRRRGQRDLCKQYPNLPLEFRALDIDRPWDAQGVAPGDFDLIYGVNVLHVAKDLIFSLQQARAALAPDGWLAIGECLRPYPRQPVYAELMFQLLESFIDVTLDPDYRPNAGFLTPAQWRTALRRAGFAHAQVAPDVERIRVIYPHFFAGAVCGCA